MAETSPADISPLPKGEPPRDCPLCPRLVEFRHDNQTAHPDWFNGAVPSFGPETARLLIVGLAPGLKGANRTRRPFLGDHLGETDQPVLGRAIGRLQHGGFLGMDRAHVDHRAGALDNRGVIDRGQRANIEDHFVLLDVIHCAHRGLGIL